MTIEQLRYRAKDVGFKREKTQGSFELYAKNIELLTVIPSVHVFGVYSIEAFIRIEGNEVHISGHYGADGSTTFLDRNISEISGEDWFTAMLELHTNQEHKQTD